MSDHPPTSPSPERPDAGTSSPPSPFSGSGGMPPDTLPYDRADTPKGPEGVEGWASCDDFLRHLSGYGVPAADEFVIGHRHLKYRDVHNFFGALAPDPMLGARDDAGEPRRKLGLSEDLPSSLVEGLEEIVGLPEAHESHDLHALARYVQKALNIPEDSHAPHLPHWANRTRILQGQRAFMTRLLPSVIVLLCKSLVEAYGAPRPASVLNLSSELTHDPYHRLLGTLQLLVSVSTPYSFEGPWYPALVTAQEMQLLHAGVRVNVAPRLVEPKRGPTTLRSGETIGTEEDVLWGGYEAFRRGWPYRTEDEPDADPPQVAVSQTDMLATTIAFALLVVDGLEELNVPMDDDDAEAYWHLWRVFAVRKGMHPPDRPEDGSWVPETLAEARAFWRTYQRNYLVGPTERKGDWIEAAKRENPSGYALTSAHLTMVAKVLKSELRWLPIGETGWLHVVRYYVQRLCGTEAAARVGVPEARFRWFLRVALETGPGIWARLWSRMDVNAHVAISRRFLTGLIQKVYGARVVFPIPQTAKDLQDFVHGTTRHGSLPKSVPDSKSVPD